MKALAVFFALGLSMSAQAASTGGRLQTVAIPGAESKVITLDDLDKAYSACMLGNEGGWVSTESQTLMPKIPNLAQKIAQLAALSPLELGANVGQFVQIGQDSEHQPSAADGQFPFIGVVTYSSSENKAGFEGFSLQEVNWERNGKEWTDCSAGQQTNCSITDVNTQNLFLAKGQPKIKADRITIEINPSHDKHQTLRSVVLISEKNVILPFFSFSSAIDNSEFDSLGVHKPGQKAVAGIALQVPEAMNTPVTFVNAQTNRPSKVVIDFKEFVSCLANEAQKRLK